MPKPADLANKTVPAGRSFRFPRDARLKRKRLIRPLFDRRRKDVGTVAAGCVRLLYRTVAREETGCDVPVQIGFAPGRRVRNAVQRNRIRRLMREVYRVHQHLLVDLFVHLSDTHCKDTLVVMVLFRGNPDTAAETLPADLTKALQRLRDALMENYV